MKTETKMSDFDKACKELGLEQGRNYDPFLPFKGKDRIGCFVVGVIEPGRDATYVPKKGKNKGKKQNTKYFRMVVEKTDMPDVEVGKAYTVSPTGLLLYQLTTGASEKGVKLPAMVGIKYMGFDDEERHQTEVVFPKKP